MSTSKTSRRKTCFPAKRPLFYYITDRKRLSGISLISFVRRAIRQKVDLIQIREKDLTDRELFDLTCRVVAAARGTNCRILVNGRADIALAAGAHGVHLPSAGLEISELRAWLPRRFIIGSSVHTLLEIRRAAEQKPDYLLVGHIFPTESKLAYGPPLGLDHLKKACSSVSVPVLGLGGITAELIDQVLDAGAAGIAGIGLFQNAEFDVRDADKRL